MMVLMTWMLAQMKEYFSFFYAEWRIRMPKNVRFFWHSLLYLRAIGCHFTQMNACFLVMNSKRCSTWSRLFQLRSIFKILPLRGAHSKWPNHVQKSYYMVINKGWRFYFGDTDDKSSRYSMHNLIPANVAPPSLATSINIASQKEPNYPFFLAVVVFFCLL